MQTNRKRELFFLQFILLLKPEYATDKDTPVLFSSYTPGKSKKALSLNKKKPDNKLPGF